MRIVVAGVLVDRGGRILVVQRRSGTHSEGVWEFPGGQLKPSESTATALERQLGEDLDIVADPRSFEPSIRVPWADGERDVVLQAIVVRAWAGEPNASDGAGIAWHEPWSIDPAILAPAHRPILSAVRLPIHYPITPSEATPDEAFASLLAALERGERLLQLRLPELPDEMLRTLAARLMPEVRRRGAILLLNHDVEGALALGSGAGVHLNSAQLRQFVERPLPLPRVVGASCHTADELTLAARLGCDFATLSPVLRTQSHPDAEPLGWPHFARLADAASLPVYALGGLGPDGVVTARTHAGQGVAGIRGFL